MNMHKNIEDCLYTPKASPRRAKNHRDKLSEIEQRNDKIAEYNELSGVSVARRTLADGIPMGRGMMLKVRTIPHAFTLPHRYHERLEYALANDYPDNRILLNRRVGYLGAASPVRYSILAYLEKPTDFEVKVSGAALNNTDAWSFNTLILMKDLGIGIAKTLENIAALPIHTPLDFKALNPASRAD